MLDIHGIGFAIPLYLLRKVFSAHVASSEADLVTEAFEALEIVVGQTLRFEAVEEVATQVSVARACFEHVIVDH
jgi:hypothetical protein